MTLSIPYSFTPGTKAKAEEVNANFNYLAENTASVTDLSGATDEVKSMFVNKSQRPTGVIAANGNWVSYSGSIIRVIAGAKFVIPNGRNADGTLKNIEYTTTEQISLDLSSGNVDVGQLFIGSDGLSFCRSYQYYEQPTQPVAVTTTKQVWFNTSENVVYESLSGSTDWELSASKTPIAKFTMSGVGVITALYPFIYNVYAKNTDIDGRWVSSRYTLCQSTTLAVTSSEQTTTYDLSSYLPNDGEKYQVMVNMWLRSGTTQGSVCKCEIKGNSSSGPSVYAGYVVCPVNNNRGQVTNSVLVVVDADRKLNAVTLAATTAGIINLYVEGYRKVR